MERTARSQARARIQMVFEINEFQFIRFIDLSKRVGVEVLRCCSAKNMRSPSEGVKVLRC
jgi:hypothetical protein